MNDRLLHRRRASVIVIVLWAIALAAMVTASLQLFSYRQLTTGGEAVERIRARWAARSGLEHTLAVLTQDTEMPYGDDAKAVFLDLESVSAGDTLYASYDIRHQKDGRDLAGPLDEHSRMNINVNDPGYMLALEDVTFDIVDGVRDWLDEDDEVSTFGVERDWYMGREKPYEPRNGPMQTLGEFELVAGLDPEYWRGEDWNQNNRLDANENDGWRSLPNDDRDRRLNGGWSSSLTVYSYEAGATASGEPRLYLRHARPEEVQERLGVDRMQARALISFGKNEENKLQMLYTQALPPPTIGTVTSTTPVTPLSKAQIDMVMNECSMRPLYERNGGRMNINTVSETLIRDLFEVIGIDEMIADEIIFMRSSRPQGIVSLQDLGDIPDLAPAQLNTLTDLFTTTSNVFTVSSRGRAWATGLEVEIIAVVDRSTIPVRIIEYREQ